jgi:AAHS family 4-hydroxybenzoate transporter-like MFS transporter
VREADPNTINVNRIIDDGPIRQFQVLSIVLCALVAFLDGVDSQSIAVAAPIIADNLKLTRAALGPMFSAALLGAAIGALTFGPLGDRFGRKRILIAATIIFAIFTLATPLAGSYQSLLAVRFAAGIGLGGATPCFIALASEFSPGRRRAMVASLIWAAGGLRATRLSAGTTGLFSIAPANACASLGRK